MKEVAGEELTPVQARDLLSYLDATGDTRVGMEEFKHFMSSSELRLTDPKSFMWSPTKKFCEEHGIKKVKPGSSAPQFMEPQQSQAEEEQDDGGPADLFDVQDMTLMGGLDQTRRPTSMGRASVKPPSSLKPAKEAPRGGRLHKRTLKDDDIQEALKITEAPAASSTSGTKEEKSKKQGLVIDEKTKTRINQCLDKYEEQTWSKMLAEQEAFRKKLFNQFATATPGVMDSTEYHKMLIKLHKLARSAMPGELKAADTLATLKYIVEEGNKSKERGKGGKEDKKKEGYKKIDPEKDSGALPVVSDADLKLTYELWYEVMSGRGRSEAVKAEAKKEGKS